MKWKRDLILESSMDDQPYYGPRIDLQYAKHIGNYIDLHITLVPSLIIQGFQMVRGAETDWMFGLKDCLEVHCLEQLLATGTSSRGNL